MSWTWISLTVVVFFGLVLACVAFLNKQEENQKKNPPKSNKIENFDEKIRQAFNQNDQRPEVKSAEEKTRNKKIICKYCGGKYNADLDKCPNCGAPPEPTN